MIPFGHLNIHRRDHDSVVTDCGRHDRVVAFLPDARGLYCRVDHLHRLGMPTADQVLKVARKSQGVRGRWRLMATETAPDGTCTDFQFVREVQP